MFLLPPAERGSVAVPEEGGEECRELSVPGAGTALVHDGVSASTSKLILAQYLV